MARLPQPGADNGTWGDILNEYLSQTLKTDGTLKNNVITTAHIQNGSITETQLDTALQNKLNIVGSGGIADGTITTLKLQDGAVTDIKISASAAIAQSKIANLTTDLANKANVSHTHVATDIASGTIASARLGSGTANDSTFLRGDGTWATPTGAGDVTLTGVQTLTHKTLTLPRVDAILDSNGAVALTIDSSLNAVNYMRLHNNSTGNGVSIYADGSDDDIYLGLIPKGNGNLYTHAPAGHTPSFAIFGDDPDVSLNLAPKGNGKVYVNFVELTTEADTPRYIRYSSGWPARPVDSRMTFFIGGSSSTDEPSDINTTVGDVWIPAS